MRFKLLLQLELKTALKKFPQMLIGAIALILLISAVAFCSNEYLYKLPIEANIKIAIASEDESFLMNFFTNAIQESESFKSVSSFVPCDKEDIPDMFDNGEAIAGIIIAPTVADDILSGKNTPIEIVFPDNSGFEAAIISEITKAISSMISTAQTDIHCGKFFYNAHDKRTEKSAMVTRLNTKNISTILFRDSVFKESYISGTGDISSANYYTTSGLVMFLLLFSINIATFYKHYNKHMVHKLTLNNVGMLPQLTVKYISILSIYILLLPVLLIFLSTILQPGAVIKLIIPLIFSVICISALSLLVYEFFKNTTACIMFIFILSVCLSFASGCLIPSLMLPETINKFSMILPTTYIIEAINNIFIGEFSIIPYLWITAFTLVFISLTYGAKSISTKLIH